MPLCPSNPLSSTLDGYISAEIIPFWQKFWQKVSPIASRRPVSRRGQVPLFVTPGWQIEGAVRAVLESSPPGLNRPSVPALSSGARLSRAIARLAVQRGRLSDRQCSADRASVLFPRFGSPAPPGMPFGVGAFVEQAQAFPQDVFRRVDVAIVLGTAGRACARPVGSLQAGVDVAAYRAGFASRKEAADHHDDAAAPYRFVTQLPTSPFQISCAVVTWPGWHESHSTPCPSRATF